MLLLFNDVFLLEFIKFVLYCFLTGECDASYFCASKASTSTPTDGVTGNVCPTGNFCPNGTATPIPCADGEATCDLHSVVI